MLTDAGDGTKHTANKNPNESDLDHKSDGTITGAYKDWSGWSSVAEEAYVTDGYSRYSGPNNEENNPLCKPIDIGLYEYQYISDFSTMEAIYVDTISHGEGSGKSWANATDDLRGAIVGAANPSQETAERVVYVRDGNYSLNRLSAGSAYILNMSSSTLSKSLTLKGSCTGSGDQQDFSKQTVLRNDGSTNDLMAVSANAKSVTIEGFTFINTSKSGTGMDASTETDGSLTLKNCGFRISNKGLDITGNSGKMLIYNTLFADGGTGLSGADNQTTVVNATFANNTTDYTATETPAIYNSVAWKNGAQNLTTYATSNSSNNNVAIAGTVANDNINEGPNFRDPDNTVIESRDYRIRPSVTLLNKGSNDYYKTQVGISMFDDEKDLGNNARLVDDAIDVGAYEYEAPLQPIVYVKADLTGTADGKSWETALGDLQGAVDLAGLYASDPNHLGENGYVFVHGNYHDDGTINLTLGNTKVYGGMNDERSDVALEDDFSNVDAVVNSLLGKRKGMLEASNRSSLGTVTIGANGVIDGFEVTGAATVNDGALSTSVVTGSVNGKAAGLLYNSLVLGNVSGVKAVNVTATGTIESVTGNNRVSATGNNTYVTDEYWNYQLMETSTDIDPTGDRTNISAYMTKVGHSRDLIGNARIRNTVDNGCFETWNISSDYTITATDYPVSKSVVYVRSGKELGIEKASDGTLVYPNGNAFNPGFLLLEHQAGLRGNGNYISLTNFAVERNVPGNGSDLANIPFTVSNIVEETNNVITYQIYNGQTRAGYNYKFDSSDSKAWEDLTTVAGKQALALNNSGTDEVTVRFYGNSYEENGKDKDVELTKWNFNDSWTTDNPGTGNRFTHKENMSWNLFGSPYLCAMNYSDMEYGRVIYGYDENYKTVNTAEVGTEGGHIPAGSAVFTQTATLKDAETFAVKQPADAKNGKAFARMAPLRIALYAAGTTRSTRGTGDLTDDAPQFVDELQLEAVDPEMARNDFDPGADGVKWMAPDNLPQIYAERGGGRYALLSAVSRSGEVAVSLNVPAVGAYTFALPEDCDASDYEAVLLKDSRTGRTADLLQAPYEFLADEAGTLAGRFTVSFTLADATADGTAIRVQAEGRGRALLIGLQAGDRIRVYDPNGQLHDEAVAGGPTAAFRLQPGIFFFHVDRGGRETTVKAVVR